MQVGILGSGLMGAETLARTAPKARVVAAFQTVPSEVLLAYRFERFRPAR